MRVLVWNVHGFRAGVGRVAEVANDLEPDVALITECSTAHRVRRFADALGMSAYHGSLPPLLRRARNAVLLREPFRVQGFDEHLFVGSARWHPRGAVVVRLDGGATVAVTHLGLSGEERNHHVAELIEVLGSVKGPVILGGDLNEYPGRGAARALNERFDDAWRGEGGYTFPSDEPSARIDYVFTREVEVRRCLPVAGPKIEVASDHLPVVADVILPG